MFLDFILKALSNVWPMLFIFTVILVSLRLTYLIYNKKDIIIYKEILMLCFIFYILLLYYFVTFQDSNFGTNNFVPFKEILRYKIPSSLFFKNVIGNITLFIPLGIFISYYIGNKNFIIPFILSLIISCSIELAQGLIGRTVDIDDVLLNSTGGLVGYLIYVRGNKIVEHMPKFMRSRIFLDIMVTVILLVLIYLLVMFKVWRYL